MGLVGNRDTALSTMRMRVQRVHEGAEPVSLNSLFSQFRQGSKRGCQSVRAVFTTHSSNPYRARLFYQAAPATMQVTQPQLQPVDPWLSPAAALG